MSHLINYRTLLFSENSKKINFSLSKVSNSNKNLIIFSCGKQNFEFNSKLKIYNGLVLLGNIKV